MSDQITAYFVGGPKHGDIDCLAADARDYRCAITGETRRQAIIDQGHYSYTPMHYSSYDTGIYIRDRELWNMPGWNPSRKNVLFIWAGVR